MPVVIKAIAVNVSNRDLNSKLVIKVIKSIDVTLGHLLVIYKGIHEKPLVDELLPLGLLISQVSVVVVGDDDAV